ncbi:uncharacterized protein EV420DRAFT_1654359 [Desarmillaria tabescens]|uniref:Uncharacterized protein n=1 Tax=Armillaria tabescens TaxID=1929756 RepID=A0AA39J0E4_ARMTA|nr:uncharacterized protein EV420DRAFT_1654359 [Desarmillaria tabescens]KAK0433837.1 hypothetical protein EV420DRAFT_1654359 [Desarmillaria tabescens]
MDNSVDLDPHLLITGGDCQQLLVSANSKDEEIGEASLIAVGDVLPTRFWADKLGGWKKDFGAMKNAKFSLLLGEPQDAEFRKDWANTVGRINGATSQVATSTSACSCIQTENHSTQIRFGAPVFEALDPTNSVLNEVIQTWPVEAEDQMGLDQLKQTHHVNCLKVFDTDDSSVPPHKVSALLKGALVEVHFSMRHWSIHHNNQPAQHAFCCTMHQICVLKRAPPPLSSPYKGRSRPYHPLPAKKGSILNSGSLLPPAEIQSIEREPRGVSASANIENLQVSHSELTDIHSSTQLALGLADRAARASPITPALVRSSTNRSVFPSFPIPGSEGAVRLGILQQLTGPSTAYASLLGPTGPMSVINDGIENLPSVHISTPQVSFLDLDQNIPVSAKPMHGMEAAAMHPVHPPIYELDEGHCDLENSRERQPDAPTDANFIGHESNGGIGDPGPFQQVLYEHERDADSSQTQVSSTSSPQPQVSTSSSSKGRQSNTKAKRKNNEGDATECSLQPRVSYS